MFSGGLMVSSLGVYRYQRTMYFSDGSDPMRRTMRDNVYVRSFAVGIFETLRP